MEHIILWSLLPDVLVILLLGLGLGQTSSMTPSRTLPVAMGVALLIGGLIGYRNGRQKC